VDNSPDRHILASDLFMELASELRCSILVSLGKKPAKLSSLARELDTTVQDVHRNVSRLAEAGLVRRDDSLFRLTEYGRIVIKQISYFLFMKKHSRFFEDHTLGSMPEKFVQRIGALQNCELVSSIAPVLERLKKLESGAKRQLKIIISQAWAEEGGILIELSMHGVDVFSIVGRNTIFPREIVESTIKTMERLGVNEKMKVRMTEKIDVALYIADDQAAVMFSNMKDEVDMSALFVGSDPAFYEWCSDLFDYMWERAEGRFDVKKTRIV
jgi:predicted transcriptional regulator